MFVVAAAPRARASQHPRAAGTLLDLRARFDGDYPLAPEGTDAGGVRALSPSPRAALETVLHLARARNWHVGLGIGAVRTPLPASIGAASGPGIDAAHDALAAAARRPTGCAIRGGDRSAGDRSAGEPLEPLLDLLLTHRERWSAHRWQLHDLLEAGGTQAAAADALGITPQAVSKRARAAGLRVDAEARTALTLLLSRLTGRAPLSAAPHPGTQHPAAARPFG